MHRFELIISQDPIVLVADFDVLKETFAKDGDSYRGRKWFHEFDEVNPGCLHTFFLEIITAKPNKIF